MQFIHLMEGVYSKESCNHLIDFFERNINLAEPGGAGRSKLNNLEICLDINFKNPSSSGLEFILSNMLSEYKKKFPLIESNLGGWEITPVCQFVKYQPNNYYSYTHCENDGKLKKYNSRLFAWMIYLNDIKEGGGTYFHHQNFTTKPVAGNLYIWPAGWTHMHVGVNAPYESKYIITGWAKFINKY